MRDALALTGMAGYEERWPHQLSGGQAQRVGIARALAVKPDLLLMDEPFSAVDAITRRNLQSELIRVWQTSGAAVLFVTHASRRRPACAWCRQPSCTWRSVSAMAGPISALERLS